MFPVRWTGLFINSGHDDKLNRVRCYMPHYKNTGLQGLSRSGKPRLLYDQRFWKASGALAGTMLRRLKDGFAACSASSGRRFSRILRQLM